MTEYVCLQIYKAFANQITFAFVFAGSFRQANRFCNSHVLLCKLLHDDTASARGGDACALLLIFGIIANYGKSVVCGFTVETQKGVLQ